MLAPRTFWSSCSCDALRKMPSEVIPCISLSESPSPNRASNHSVNFSHPIIWPPRFSSQRDSHQATSLIPSQRFTTTQQAFPNTRGDSNDICTAAPSSDLCKAPCHRGSTACEVCGPSNRRMFLFWPHESYSKVHGRRVKDLPRP